MDESAQSNTSSREVILGNNDSRRRRREGWALREDYGILDRSMESRVEAGRGGYGEVRKAETDMAVTYEDDTVNIRWYSPLSELLNVSK